MNERLTTERRSMAPHPGGVDQFHRFDLIDLDGRYYWLDGVLYINADHRLATELTADSPQLPAINQAAFERLQELTEANRRLRATCRESADAYQRGYTQGLADAAVQVMERSMEGAPSISN